MPEQRPVLDHYRNQVTDRMMAVLGLSQALQGGSEAPATEEQFAAADTLRASARRLRADLDGLRSVIQGPAETTEISTLIRESFKPLSEVARHGIGVELTLPAFAVRVRSGWLAASEVLRIVARRVLEHVYEGGVLSVAAHQSGNRMIVELAHEGGTLTAAPADTHPNPADDPRFGRVKALLAGIGGSFDLERQPAGGLAARVALEVVPAAVSRRSLAAVAP
jgi:hypothetical protein